MAREVGRSGLSCAPYRGGCLPNDVPAILRPADPIVQVRFVAIVGATAQLDVLDGGLAAHPIRDDMVELEESAGLAPPSVRTHECATTRVAARDGPFHMRRGLARCPRSPPTPPRRIGDRHPLPFHIFP